ncbi:MAG: hypothetical protein ACFFDN_05270 [Candidatus Hodarchaeota archaeon]
MGKYPNSKIHELYSDWHFNLTRIDKYKILYQTDIDRLWVEYSFKFDTIIGIIDLKWEGSEDEITPTEEAVYNWFKKHKVSVWIVYITKDFKQFRVKSPKGDEEIYNEIQYAEFLLWLRNRKSIKSNNN